jgi:uncharacterized SAM-binding protein YcdF (DUF218 family)
MFFILSKTLGFFALPSNLVATLAALGVVLMFTRFRRAGRMLATLGVVLLLLAGLSPLGNILIYPLEQRFPPWDAARGAPAGIVVLGGAISPDVSAAHGTPALTEAAERLTAVAELARQYPAARIVYSGGWCAATRPSMRSPCSRASASRASASPPRTSRTTRWRTRCSARRSPIRNRASAGSW